MDYRYSRDTQDDDPLLSDKPFNRESFQPPHRRMHDSPFDNAQIDVGFDNIKIKLVQGINEDHLRETLSRSLLATTGLDPDKLLEDVPWEEMLKGGLQSALESQVVVFEIAGISRTCTHQLVRTRKAAFHQQSQRATFMGMMPNARMPESIFRNERAKAAYEAAIKATADAYWTACEEDIAYQDAREILPNASETYILCEYPLREFLATYAYRACVMFNWQIVYCFREMGRLLVESHPWLEPYVKISCEKIKRCTFQGWETVEGHCTFPWAKESERQYKPPSELKIGGDN
jgi:hypothetical protein